MLARKINDNHLEYDLSNKDSIEELHIENIHENILTIKNGGNLKELYIESCYGLTLDIIDPLSSLETFDAFEWTINDLPKFLLDCPNLSGLMLRNANIKTIPLDIQKLTKLKTIDLDFEYVNFPASLLNTKPLCEAYLANRKILIETEDLVSNLDPSKLISVYRSPIRDGMHEEKLVVIKGGEEMYP